MRKPSYKEKQDQERTALAAAGCISDRYSSIANIEFRMTYYRTLNQVLMKRTLCFSPSDYAGFHLKCMHDGCTDGGYDLAPVVAAMVKSRKISTNGKLFCRGRNTPVGHSSIAYEVHIQYSRRAE